MPHSKGLIGMSKKLIYLASPYSHPDPAVMHARYEEVCQIAARLMKQGLFVFSPIAHSHGIFQHAGHQTDFEYWREYDEMMIDKCDEIWVCDNMDGIKDYERLTKQTNVV